MTFGNSQFPFRRLDGTAPRPNLASEFPGTYDALEHVVVLPWNEFYEDEHVDFIAATIEETAVELEL